MTHEEPKDREGNEFYLWKKWFGKESRTPNETAGYWISRMREMKDEHKRILNSGRKMYEAGRAETIEEMRKMIQSKKKIPVEIPHGSPYLSGYNEAVKDVTEFLITLSDKKQSNEN